MRARGVMRPTAGLDLTSAQVAGWGNPLCSASALDACETYQRIGMDNFHVICNV